MPEAIAIVYEDTHVLVVVKPPNLPTQADASGDADLLTCMKQSIRERYHKPGAVYLGLVHRLDRPVGGLVVLARTSKAAGRLSEQARSHTLRRTYLAIVQGLTPAREQLTNFLYKDTKTNTVRVVPEGTWGAKQAILQYRTLAHADECSLLEVTLETGRSHQIRVQLRQAGFPLWGDARYGGGVPGQQIALWGARLGFEHPTLHTQLSFFSAPPGQQAPWRLFRAALCALTVAPSPDTAQ